MSSLTVIALPAEYSYVLAVAAASTLLTQFHSTLTSRRRKAAQVPYPTMFVSSEEADKSPEKHAFNCAQKAHVNFNENYPQFLVGLAVAGLQYPVAAAGLGASWIVGRFLYGWGYSRVGRQYSTNGKGRLIGAWAPLPQILLAGTAIYSMVSKLL